MFSRRSVWILLAAGTLAPLYAQTAMVTQLGDLRVERTSPTVLTIGPNCSAKTPCNFRLGGHVFHVANPATVTLVSASPTGSAFLYVSESGGLTAGATPGVKLTCAGGCSIEPNLTGFPPGAIPLFRWPAQAKAGNWDSEGSDERAMLSATPVAAGPGLSRMENPINGVSTLSVDPAQVGIRVPVPGNARANCNAGAWAADDAFFYLCVATNSWRRASLSSW